MIISVTDGDYRYRSVLTPQKGQTLSQMVSTKDTSKSIASFQNYLQQALGMVYDDSTPKTARQLMNQVSDRLSARVGTAASSDVTAATDTKSGGVTLPFSVPSSLKGIFEEASEKYGVSEQLLEAIAYHESRFQTDATSSSGAMGVMQLMPDTARSLGVSNAYDPHENIMGAAKLVSNLLNEFNGNLDLAMAAYSNGSGAVHRAGDRVPDIKQAQDYVAYIDSIFPNGI